MIFRTEQPWETAQAIAEAVTTTGKETGLTFKRRVNLLVGQRAAEGVRVHTDHKGRTLIADLVLERLRNR